MYLTPKTHFYSTVKLKRAKVKNDGNFVTYSFLPGFAETQVLSDLSYFSSFFFLPAGTLCWTCAVCLFRTLPRYQVKLVPKSPPTSPYMEYH